MRTTKTLVTHVRLFHLRSLHSFRPFYNSVSSVTCALSTQHIRLMMIWKKLYAVCFRYKRVLLLPVREMLHGRRHETTEFRVRLFFRRLTSEGKGRRKKERRKALGKGEEQMCVNLSFCFDFTSFRLQKMCFIYHSALLFHDERLYCLDVAVVLPVCVPWMSEEIENEGVYGEP